MSSYTVDLLLVEDDPQLRLLIDAILTESGYSIRSAHDGWSGLAEIRRAVPDLILSDLHMPGMSGFDFLSEVRERFPHIPLIAMSSAYSGTEIPLGVVADAFYEKATSIDNLLHVVERQIRGQNQLGSATQTDPTHSHWLFYSLEDYRDAS